MTNEWPELGEAELDGMPDPPETPAERKYRLWREYCDDYELSHEELYDIEPQEGQPE
jgi:hypothetical protein